MLVEDDEYFMVQLSGGIEAINVPANPTARVTITDDDGMLFFSINSGGEMMYRFLILLTREKHKTCSFIG